MSTRSVVYRVLLASALAVLPVPALATTSPFLVSSSGDGVFVVSATLDNVAAMQLNLSYDPTTLTNPRVALGSLTRGMMNASNTGTNPIQIAAIGSKPIKGSGPVAVISFDKTGSSLGVLTALNGSIIEGSGRSVAITAQIINPTAVADLNAPSGNGNPGTGSGGDTKTPPVEIPVSNQPYVVGGSVTLPGDLLAGGQNKETPRQVAQENVERQKASEPAAASEPTPTTPPPTESQPPAPQPKKGVAQVTQPAQSVLDKFRLFAGEKSVDNLTGLFNGNGAATFSQSPAIAITDGKATVKVTITKVTGENAPTFTFNSARAVSVHSLGDGDWEVVAKPEKGAINASIVMIANGEAQEIPLTVAPKAETVLSKSGLPQDDFQLFLNDRGTATAPKYDLNGDGKRDYLDDYIYTANYLARTGGSAQVKGSEKGGQKLTAEQNK
jgi:hypothetical protein